MTINSTAAFSGPYVASGAAQSFPFDFNAVSAAEIRVIVDGNTLDPLLYTVALNSDGTGSVTPTVPVVAASIVYVESDPFFEQTTQFSRMAPVFPDALNTPLDRAAARDIAMLDRLQRVATLPRDATPVQGKFAMVGPDGQWMFVDGVPGIPGTSNNTRLSLAALKAAATTDGTSLYNGSLWTWTAGNFSGLADDVNVVKANSTALTVGAWVRQRSNGVVTQRNAIGAIVRNSQAAFDDTVSITQFGAVGGNKTLDTLGFMRAYEYARTRGRAITIPDSDVPFVFGEIVLPRNEIGIDGDTARPTPFTITGSGSVRYDGNGFLFDCEPGFAYYNLTIAGTLRFVATPGGGSKFINGGRFHRLNLLPGLDLKFFDYGVFAGSGDYLQTLRVIGVTHRGGGGAFIKAPMSYDCSICHNIVEFCQDGVVIDGNGDPAVHTTRIDDNVIEGLNGRGVVLGACLASSVSGNYMESNLAGDILLNAGTAPHKGLEVSLNSLQQNSARLAANAYAIVWGVSTALPARAGGNFSTGHLHDLTGAVGRVDVAGDVVATGKNLIKPGTGSYHRVAGTADIWGYFGRETAIDPYNQEIVFSGKYDNGGTSPVISLGTNSPANAPAQFDRKTWARGSLVINADPSAANAPWGWICTVSGTPGTWKFISQLA